MNTLVTGLIPVDAGWRVECARELPLSADAVIVATGGLSVPKTGSDGTGLVIARRLGHVVQPTYAALTPLVAAPAPFGHLAGLSLSVTVSAKSSRWRTRTTGGFLFTHKGYSGPAVLDVSHVAVRAMSEGTPATIAVRWTPLGDEEWDAALRPRGTRTVLAALSTELPDRLAAALLREAEVDPGQTLATFRREHRRRLIDVLVRGKLPWTGDEGYAKAEVTGGGVSLSEIDPRTMESRRHRGLFLCGEMLDAFGPIGGYNFFWAWATGRAAGLGAAGWLGG
jgi:predicted Rossmann fold flavoprotein